MKKVVLSALLFFGFGFFVATIKPVQALTYMKVGDYFKKCQPNKSLFRPYHGLILIDMSDIYKRAQVPVSAEVANKEILYELLYIRKVKYSPFNGIYNQKLFYHTCDTIDYTLPYVSFPNGYGGFVLGYFARNDLFLQELIDKYYIAKVYKASLKFNSDGTFQLVNVAVCDECKDLKTFDKGLEARPYQLKLEKVSFAKQVDQLKTHRVALKLKNLSEIPLPSRKFVKIAVVKIKGSGDIYDSSWISEKTVGWANPDHYVFKDETFDFSFKLGRFLVPGDYSAKFALKIGKKQISEFSVKFKVKDNGYKLARIVPKAGDYANVRKSPGLRGEVLFRVDAGETVVWHKQEGAWVYIETKDGHKGWVYRPFVRRIR